MGNVRHDKFNSDEQRKEGNTTICAKQILHLDADGLPLWFNGGVHGFGGDLEEHVDNLPLDSYGYFAESTDPHIPFKWRQHENGKYFCLTSDYVSVFNDNDSLTLNWISDFARQLDMYGE